MVLVQNWPFFHLLFLGNISQEKVFYDILERKNAFLGYKNNKFKKSENWDFCKGLTHGFGPKCVLRVLRFQNVFYEILERKNAFLGYKKCELKKWKNCDFCKGVDPWFWSKIGHFSTFLLGNIGQETVFYDILERENTSLGYKNKKFKKSKNWDLCKGVNPWFWSKIGHFSIFCF